jgi:penicillin amidase
VKKKGNFGKVIKIVLISLLAVIILLAGGGFAYYLSMINSPQPQVDGNLQAMGLKDKVEVLRDNSGVPHIYAKNMHDLFFAQGYTQAQDRWWQMEFFRKTCGGRIEELTGKKAALVNSDIYLRSLGLYRVAELEYNSYSAEDRAVLDAFAEGVNAYISDRSPQQLSVNYSILGLTGVKFKIDPWSPLDTLTFAKLMAWDLGLSRDLELTRLKLYDKLGTEMADQWLVPAWPLGQKPTILMDEDVKAAFPNSAPAQPAGGTRAPNNVSQVYQDSTPDLSSVTGNIEGSGSNSWAATGSMTKGGTAILAGDPHLGIQQPSIWYETSLHCSDDGSGKPFDVAGFAFAPDPCVVIGHNNDIAWTNTNVYPDVNDQYQIKVNPDNPLQYEWNGKWRDMTVREEKISFGDGKPPLTIKVRSTHLGPITNENKYDARTGELAGFNNKDPLSLHWTALEPTTITLSFIRLNKASNWDEFVSALKYFDVPSQSLTYADNQGNIGYLMPGKIPIRTANHTGQVPVSGWTSDYEWKGYVPLDLMPRIYNPARNFIVASNQEVAPPQYYAFLGKQLGPDVNANFGSQYNKWVYGYRSQREYELIKQLAPNTVATYQAIQGDNKLLSAGEVIPSLSNLKFDDPEVSSARDWLVKWDLFCNEDSPQAALYNEFWMKLINNIYQNKMGDIVKSDGVDREMWAVNLLLQNPSNSWWDDPATKDIKETRDDVLSRSFREGYTATVTALGKDRNAWKWGNLHKAVFISNPLGASGIAPIESIVNPSPVPAGGNTECVNSMMWYASTGNFNIRLIPSMRMIVDLANLDNSVSINSSGQSGHPGNPWYSDQAVPWARVKYHPMLWTRQQVDSAATHRLMLNP